MRGLGERYSATQLNGAVVPTTEPEKRVVPLDLFPTGMIDNIKIAKTYSPDLPAEFSGGLVQLKTVEFPTQQMFTISIEGGFNTATTFRPVPDVSRRRHGGFLRLRLGLARAPADLSREMARSFSGNCSPAELQTFGRAFSDNWQPSQREFRDGRRWTGRPSGGGTFGRFGIVGALSFSQQAADLQRNPALFRPGPSLTQPEIFTDYPDYHQYIESARMGAVFNAAIRLTPNHKLIFRNTYTHEAEKSAREFAGYDRYLDTNLAAERLRYIERSLFSTGVERRSLRARPGTTACFTGSSPTRDPTATSPICAKSSATCSPTAGTFSRRPAPPACVSSIRPE